VFVWILWKARNEKIFNNMIESADDWIEEIKNLSWKMILVKAKVAGFNYNLLLHPSQNNCLFIIFFSASN